MTIFFLGWKAGRCRDPSAFGDNLLFAPLRKRGSFYPLYRRGRRGVDTAVEKRER